MIRKTEPLRMLDEGRALAMASPTAAELPIKGRIFQVNYFLFRLLISVHYNFDRLFRILIYLIVNDL